MGVSWPSVPAPSYRNYGCCSFLAIRRTSFPTRGSCKTESNSWPNRIRPRCLLVEYESYSSGDELIFFVRPWLLVHLVEDLFRTTLGDEPVVAEGLAERQPSKEDDDRDQAGDGHVVALADDLEEVLEPLVELLRQRHGKE